MRFTIFAAMFAFLLWGSPAFAGSGGVDTDGDGIVDPADNCRLIANNAQDDTDGDDCGNYCDADFDQDGVTGFLDFGQFGQAFQTNDEEKCLQGVIPGCTVGFLDFGVFGQRFQTAPGPSGTSAGTVACPN